MTCAVCELPIKPPRRQYCERHDPRKSWYGLRMTKGGGQGTKRYVEHARKRLLQENQQMLAVAERLQDPDGSVLLASHAVVKSRYNDTQPYKLYLIDGWHAPQELPLDADPLDVLSDHVWEAIREEERRAEKRLANLQNLVPDIHLVTP